MRSIVHIVFCAVVFFSCSEKQDFKTEEGDVRIASVNNRHLYLSSLDGLFGPNSTAKDSQQVVRNYSEKWIREILMLGEAEKNLSASINIDKMVDDYRTSLLIANYESQLVANKLDTVITRQQLEAYYEENKDQYLLSSPIIKYDFAKVRLKTKGLDRFYANWRKDNTRTVREYLKGNAEYYVVGDTSWHEMEELSALLPQDLFKESAFKKKQDLQKASGDYEYFVKIRDFIDNQQIPPLAYIEDKIKKVILHKRKITLLDEKREKLYDKEILTNKVKMYPLKTGN